MIKVLRISEELGLYRLFLENKNDILVNSDDILKYQLLSKKVINESDYEVLLKHNTINQCYYDAYKLINQKWYTIHQFKNKLLLKKHDHELIDIIIDEFINNHYLDDDLYEKEYIELKIGQGFGPFYIKNKLYHLGIMMKTDIDEMMQREALLNYFKRCSYKIKNENDFNKEVIKLKKQGFYYDLIIEMYDMLHQEEELCLSTNLRNTVK
ncbi:MAG: RecX family transcriptional regulator [Bacilli bacterium]|jgi:SOS response regulatory protein OraA/RecX|nr:RecX family transcriptional regulator [Bacilli bacterium]